MQLLVAVLGVLLIGCTTAGNAPATSSGPAPTSFPQAAVNPTQPEATSNAELGTVSEISGPVVIEIGDGSLARYLVREQLARVNLPSDAVGETSDVSGTIAFDAAGVIDSELSKITISLSTMTSDKERRDRFLRTRSLESDKFPTAEFSPREVTGLPWPLPSQGQVDFELSGDMTVHGVTRPITWDITGQINEDSLSGLATTSFTFDEFDMEIPRLRILLSVDNEIRLELDLKASVRRGQ